MNHVPDSVHIQARWNSIIVATLMRNAALLELVAVGETSPAKLPQACHQVITKLCEVLLESACKQNVDRPKACARIERMINRELWDALKLYGNTKHIGTHEQLTLDPYEPSIRAAHARR